MSSLREPGLGPIIGHTTDKGCRIWIRSGEAHDENADLSSEQRTIGVAAVIEKNGVKLDPKKDEITVFYFRLHREFDRTGSYFFGSDHCLCGKPPEPLTPQTNYTVRVGTLTIDDPFGDDQNIASEFLARRLPEPKVWVDDLLKLRPKCCSFTSGTFAKKVGCPARTADSFPSRPPVSTDATRSWS